MRPLGIQPKHDGHTRNGLDLSDERLLIAARDRYTCQSCGKVCPYGEGEIAHLIANTTCNRKHYGSRVIDSPTNKAWTHRGRCNSLQNCAGKPDECAEIVARVEKEKV